MNQDQQEESVCEQEHNPTPPTTPPHEATSKCQEETPNKDEFLIKVSADPKVSLNKYVGVGTYHLQKGSGNLAIKAFGNAVTRAVMLTQILKDNVGWLHQTNSTYTVTLNTREGGKPQKVSAIEVKLSKSELDQTHSGYQKPQPPMPQGKLSTRLTMQEVTDRRQQKASVSGAKKENVRPALKAELVKN